MGRAKKLEDIAFAIANMNAPPRLSEQFCRLLHVLQPPDAFFLLDRYPRRIDLLLERGGSLKLLPAPELDGCQPQGNSFYRHRQARMHQNSAHRVRPQSPSLVASTVDSARRADRVGLLSLKRKFGRIMQHQERSAVRRNPISCRLKMAGENFLFADGVIGEK